MAEFTDPPSQHLEKTIKRASDGLVPETWIAGLTCGWFTGLTAWGCRNRSGYGRRAGAAAVAGGAR